MESSIADVCVGGRDLERAVAELASRIPDALAPLAELAYNYRWSWMTGGEEVFRDVDPERFVAIREIDP